MITALKTSLKIKWYRVISRNYFFKVLLFLERGREEDREKHQCVLASQAPPSGHMACNLGMCPDWELNQRSFGLQSGAQSTEPHQPGPL